MSRADWSFLERLLEEGEERSTCAGRAWLTVLLLFRVLVLGAAAESAWDDEQSDFVCNTQQPGCGSVCYDRAFPISHFRYFVLQVIFVSTPTVFYLGYAAVRGAGDAPRGGEEGEEEEGEGEATEEGATAGATRSEKAEGEANRAMDAATDAATEASSRPSSSGVAAGNAKALPPATPKLKGRLLAAYTASVSATVLLEAGFMGGLWLLYDGFVVAPLYECVGPPCPHTVDCFVSRPTEKTIFTVYTQAIAGLSLLLNLAELLHLLQRLASRRLEKRCRPSMPSPRSRSPRSTPPRSPRRSGDERRTGAQVEEAPSYLLVHVDGYPDPPGTPAEASWGVGARGELGTPEGDIPPSYLNCLGGMHSPRSPRPHVKKHNQGKHRKDHHRSPGKLKHYV